MNSSSFGCNWVYKALIAALHFICEQMVAPDLIDMLNAFTFIDIYILFK